MPDQLREGPFSVSPLAAQKSLIFCRRVAQSRGVTKIPQNVSVVWSPLNGAPQKKQQEQWFSCRLFLSPAALLSTPPANLSGNAFIYLQHIGKEGNGKRSCLKHVHTSNCTGKAHELQFVYCVRCGGTYGMCVWVCCVATEYSMRPFSRDGESLIYESPNFVWTNIYKNTVIISEALIKILKVGRFAYAIGTTEPLRHQPF